MFSIINFKGNNLFITCKTISEEHTYRFPKLDEPHI